MNANADTPNRTVPRTRRGALARVLGLALAGALVLSACGGGSDGPPPAAPPAPSLQIVISGEGVIGGDTPVSFKFGAAVAGFEASRVLLDGGTFKPGSFVQVSPVEYAAVIVPRDNARGTLTVGVPPNGFFDASYTNGNQVNCSASRPYDTVRAPTEPFVSFSDDAPSGVTAGPVRVTVTFNLDVGDSFTVNKLLLTNATASDFIRVSATEYRMVLTPVTRGVMILDIPAGAVTAAVQGGTSNSRGWQWGKIHLP
jgi:hypothetical protein